MKKYLFIVLILIVTSATAQEYKSFTVENVSEKSVWEAVYKTMQELKLPHVSVNKNTGKGESGYYNYTALMIKNRCRFRFEYNEGTLTVSVFGRQYMSDKGWADNILPMSKKQASNLLDPIEKRLSKLSNIEASPNVEAVATPTQQQPGSNINKAGIYDDFVLIGTEDDQLEVLAIFANGNIFGFDLWEDKTTVKTIIFKENKDADASILEFDKNGYPVFMGIEDLVIKIKPNTSGKHLLSIKNKEGKFIGEESISINTPPLPQRLNMLYENSGGGHGFSYYPESTKFEENLSTWLGYGSLAFTGLVAGLQGSPSGILEAMIKESASKIGSTEDSRISYNLDDICTLGELSAIGVLGMGGGTGMVLSTVAAGLSVPVATAAVAVGIALAGIKVSMIGWKSFKERHWPPAAISIIKPNEPIRVGSFGEYNLSSGYLAVEYNYPDKSKTNEPLQIIIDHPEELKVEYLSTDDFERYSKTYYNVYARKTEHVKHRITFYRIIDDVSNSQEIEIEIEEPKYYYLQKNCNNCTDDPSHLKECEEKFEQCKLSFTDNQDIYFILDATDKIIECNKELNDERLSYIKSYNLENHGLKSFVTEAPCSCNCEGLTDKETIVSLAHEAMDKIKINDDKIKTLQKAAELTIKENQDANNTQLLKIASDINTLEESSKKIKNEYGDKINTIAEKGTILYPFEITDPNDKCYDIKRVRIKGAHWSRPFLTILLSYEYTRKSCHLELEHGMTYDGEGVSDITYKFFGKDNNEIMKAASSIAGFSTITMDITQFEQTERIEFFKSNVGGPFN